MGTITKTPFFSVIVPTFNRAKPLKRALESIGNQTFVDFEVLIINDGSDLFLDFYNDLKDQFDSRFHFFYSENKGPAAARNFGINKSIGQFICFLDDDDFYYQSHLETIYRSLSENSFRKALYRTFSDISCASNSKQSQPFKEIKKDASIAQVIEHLFEVPMYMNNVSISASILKEMNFNDQIIFGEDYELWLRIVTRYPYVQINEITAVYDRSNESLSNGDAEKFMKYIETTDIIFSDSLVNKFTRPSFRKSIYNKYYSWILDHYSKLNDGNSMKFIEKDMFSRTSMTFYLKAFIKFRTVFLLKWINSFSGKS